MRVIKIKTSAWTEEDFYLVTTLDDDQITEVIKPIVQAERDNDDFYDNDTLLNALKDTYPNRYIEMYTESDELIF